MKFTVLISVVGIGLSALADEYPTLPGNLKQAFLQQELLPEKLDPKTTKCTLSIVKMGNANPVFPSIELDVAQLKKDELVFVREPASNQFKPNSALRTTRSQSVPALDFVSVALFVDRQGKSGIQIRGKELDGGTREFYSVVYSNNESFIGMTATGGSKRVYQVNCAAR